MRSKSFVGVAATAAMVVVGCGDPDAEVPVGAPAAALTCADDLAEIVDLLRVGAPAYDYDPATDLAELTTTVDVVVAGPVERLSRSADGETIVAESSGLSQLGPDDVAGPASGFDVDGVWAERDVADPLSAPIEVDDLEVVAFLHQRGVGPGRFVPGPQGLYLGCADSELPATSAFDPAPAGASGLSVSALEAAVRSIFASSPAPSSAPSSVPPASDSTAVALPLHRQHPSVELVVDGASLTELRLGFEQWDDEQSWPPEPEPDVGVVVSDDADLALLGDHPADATVTLFRLDETLRFVPDSTIEWNGIDTAVPVAGPGTWFVDVRAAFGPSPEYGGTGVLRAGAWLHVTPGDAPCATPNVTPAFGPDSNVTGVVDRDGCLVAATDAGLNLGALTPWFHCAPWPPALQWRTGDDTTMTRFWQYEFGAPEIEVVTAPDDAVPTGRFIPAGEILTAPSDPDALFVQARDGTTQRWIVPAEEEGCA